MSFKALVVEDDTSLSGVVRDVLAEIGCDDVRFVTTGVAALSAARSVEPDLILLDLGLPDLDGLDVCRQLTAQFPSVPIVIITSRNDDSVVQIAFEAGAQDYVAKPFRIGELGARARAALRLRAERRLRGLREVQLEQSKHDLERAVCIDPLTGVANRGHFDGLLEVEWSRAARHASTLSLVVADVDDFHAFNEHYSHLGGDSCLKAIAGALAHCLRRPSDMIARYGGEEFVALLPDTDAAGACVVAERLRTAVEELGVVHAGSRCARVVTLSAGVATLAATDGRSPIDLVSAADRALFRAKALGRNRWCADAEVPSEVVVLRRPWPICPVVRADPYMAQHVPQFLESRRGEIGRLREAVGSGDLATVRVIGHKLKGAGGTFGFDALSALGARLEQAALDENRSSAADVIEELAWYLEHVHVVYRRPSAGLRTT